MVAAVRRGLGTRSVGHAGTLDPFATGLLVVLVGRATRLARFIEGLPKRYDAVARLGEATDTDDATGTVAVARPLTPWPTADQVAEALGSFVGPLSQRPPAYSAKHVGGVRSHVLARSGTLLELEPVDVQVYDATLEGYDPPDVQFTATVSRGTYIRAIARDLGERLGTAAHCSALRRMSSGTFSVADAIAPHEATREALLAPSALLEHLDRQVIDQGGEREVSFGRAVTLTIAADGFVAMVAADGRLVAVAEARDGVAHPVVVLEPAA